jgi:serine/threonine protein kinase/ankyrin repeat protein
MTSYLYQSAFTHDSYSLPTQAHDIENTTGNATTPPPSSHDNSASSDGLATFICHAAYLDTQLQRGDRSAFFSAHQARLVNRERIGHGLTFVVERAELDDAPRADVDVEPLPPSIAGSSKQTIATKRVVVLKTVREDNTRSNRNQWAEVLLEIRALLHEPVRYHPNIVRLLDIRWDASADTGSPFPGLVVEYAKYGTLASLQHSSAPLPFSIKQKLCYDIGRALSIIHACGMIHGDLKHENILVFANPYNNPPNQPYIAKLSDFGGTVMDTSDASLHVLPMHTFPFEAPELASHPALSASAARGTDAYSYGMLIWRCMLDGADLLPLILASSSPAGPHAQMSDPSAVRTYVTLLKNSDAVLESAIASLSAYRLPAPSFTTVVSALLHTLRGSPSHRALDRAQMRLRGMDAPTAFHYVAVKEEANRKTLQQRGGDIPGRQGMSMDSVGFALGRLGNDYDAQNNLPGFRPDLARPEPMGGHFLFEPDRLRDLLEWERQQGMVGEFEAFANGQRGRQEGMKPHEAAYFVFQSYVWRFGAGFDKEKLCHWLRKAAEPQEEMGETDYYASAWLGRICAALGGINPWDEETQVHNLKMGIVRGHRNCVEDIETLISTCGNDRKKEEWRKGLRDAKFVWKFLTGGTGMPFFSPRKLSRDWELNNMDALDEQVRRELGSEYISALRATETAEEDDPDRFRFDKIYVNHKGHGLLHMAAVQGKVAALRHLYAKYRCDINLANQSHSDTPLVCACRTAWFDCATLLIDNGADPNGSSLSEESPLHCISDFDPGEMDVVVLKLVRAGADLEKLTRPSNKDVRGVLADWEDSDSMSLTPLGRAVLRRSLPAVMTLLRHGASPTGKPAEGTKTYISPIELAAVLTLPEILEELLRHVADAEPILDECELLDKARSRTITPYDSLSLHSRLVRCGVPYKEWLQRTLGILRHRRRPNTPSHPPGKHLCTEIALGNVDIVESLLDLGHTVEGSREWRPIRFALMSNNTDIFKLLMSRGPPIAFKENEYESMLHLLAQRHRYAPNDLDIARSLLDQTKAEGMDCDASVPGQPSPLVLAIRHRFFSFADLLVEHGAGPSVDVLHPSHLTGIPSGAKASLVASLFLAPHTSATLQAIYYLSTLHRKHHTLGPLALEGENGQPISNLHALPLIPESHMTNQSQLTSRILHLVLSIDPSTESLGQVAPMLGTPLTAAVLLGAQDVVTTLVESGWQDGRHRAESAVDVAVRIAFDRDALWHTEGEVLQTTKFSPIALAQQIVTQRLGRLEGKDAEKTWEAVKALKRATAIVRILEQPDIPATDPRHQDSFWARNNINTRISALEKQAAVAADEPEIVRDTEEANLPVDLSVLTEEKPSGWQEGCEMTQEMSLRIFLRHFRAENSGFGDGIVKQMGGMFNK